MKLISVIIPAYNAEKYIVNCVQSVLRQTYKQIEIIIVNDGSTDQTLQILEKIAAEHACVHVFSQENGGVSAARNAAISKATGDYLTMVDADDDLPETALEDMAALMTDDVDLVIGSHCEVRLSYRKHLERIDYFKPEELETRFRQFDPMIWFPWAKMFRHSVIQENQIKYDTNITFGEDHIFNLQFAKAMTGAAVSTDKIVYNYHYIRGGLCAKYYPNMDGLQRYVLNGLIRFFGTAADFPEEYRVHYVGCYLTGCMDYYIAWCNRKEATARIRAAFGVYSDLLDEKVHREFFDEKQRQMIASGDFDALTKDYIRKNPRKTIWRKIKRKIRMVLEWIEKLK